MSGSDHESLASRFVHGRHVNWRGVANTLVSSMVFQIGAGIIAFWIAVFRQPARLIMGTWEFLSALLSRPFELAADLFGTAWATAAGVFPLAGPLDFAAGVLLIAVTFWIMAELTSRVVRGVFGS